MPSSDAAAALPLRWGGYRSRILGGLALATGGGILVIGSDTFQLGLLGLGQLALSVGWLVLPAAGWRRIVAMLVASLGCWLLLGGPELIPAALLPLIAWLLVRHRPPVAWLGALVPPAAFVVAELVLLPHDYSGMLIELVVTSGVLAASAQLAAGIDRVQREHGARTARADTMQTPHAPIAGD